MHYFKVTEDNIEQVREEISSLDQREKLEVGCETWAVFYTGRQRGQMTVWPDKGLAALDLGGNSIWGDWDSNARNLITEDEDENGFKIVYDENGEHIAPDLDCST